MTVNQNVKTSTAVAPAPGRHAGISISTRGIITGYTENSIECRQTCNR
jgi:hypothetical protein